MIFWHVVKFRSFESCQVEPSMDPANPLTRGARMWVWGYVDWKQGNNGKIIKLNGNFVWCSWWVKNILVFRSEQNDGVNVGGVWLMSPQSGHVRHGKDNKGVPNLIQFVKMIKMRHISMVFPWFSHGVPMVFPWFSHGFPMVFPRFCCSDGFLLTRLVGPRDGSFIQFNFTMEAMWPQGILSEWILWIIPFYCLKHMYHM